MMRLFGKKGFTLVEIMIVIAIIALLAAIAIPNLLRARHNANEVAAVASLRAIAIANTSYYANQTPPTYASSLSALRSVTPPYIDSVLGGGTKQGYTFTYTGATNAYSVTATPQETGVTGTRTFYVDQSGVIRLNNSSGSPIS